MRTQFQINIKSSGLSFWQLVEVEIVCLGNIEKAVRTALIEWTGGSAKYWDKKVLNAEVTKLVSQYQESTL